MDLSQMTTWMPLVVFVAELTVVTLATIRIIFLGRGLKAAAAVLGFFEVSIWLFAIGQVMSNLGDWRCSVAFAAGFTLGNYVGVLVEQKLALGHLVVRIITPKGATELIRRLRTVGYGVTSIDAEGGQGPVKVVFTIIPRKSWNEVLSLIRAFDPQTFYSVDEIQEAGRGIFPATQRGFRGLLPFGVPALRRPA